VLETQSRLQQTEVSRPGILPLLTQSSPGVRLTGIARLPNKTLRKVTYFTLSLLSTNTIEMLLRSNVESTIYRSKGRYYPIVKFVYRHNLG